MIRLFSLLTLLLALAGCSTTKPSSGPKNVGVRVPNGFTDIPSRVPGEEWKRVFFRVARDVRLLPKLHPHVFDVKVRLLRAADERTLLFIAHARLTKNADENFWKHTARRLYEPDMAPDFVQIRHYANRSLTESEAYLRGDAAAKTVITISDNRQGSVYLLGGTRLIGGDQPFLLDQIITRMSNDLNR